MPVQRPLLVFLFLAASAVGSLCLNAQSVPASNDEVSRFIGDWNLFDPGLFQWMSEDELKATGAKAQPPSKVYMLGKVIHTADSYPNVGDFNLIVVKLQQFGDSLTASQRDQRVQSGQAPALPSRFVSLGLSWRSSFQDWYNVLQSQKDLTLFGTAPGTVTFKQITASDARAGVERRFSGRITLHWLGDTHLTALIFFDSGDSLSPQATDTMTEFQLVYWDRDQKPLALPSPDSTLDRDHRFALGLSGILIQMNHQSHENLEPRPRQAAYQQAEAKSLARDWGITTKAQLEAMLVKLQNGLHSKDYKRFIALLDAHPGVSPGQLSDSLRLNIADTAHLLFASGVRDKLGDVGIEAWDLGRCVALARWGYELDLLTADEAWKTIMTVWQRVQHQYHSWNDWALHYMAGRAYWGVATGDDVRNLDEAMKDWEQLTLMENSIYRKPWPDYSGTPRPDQPAESLVFQPDREGNAWLTVLDAWKQKASNPSQALVMMLAARHLAPASFGIQSNLTELEVAEGRTSEAKEEAWRAVTANPEVVVFQLDLADAAMARGELPAAEDAWKKALTLDSSCFEALAGLAKLAENRKEFQAAADLFVKAAQTLGPETSVGANLAFWMEYSVNAMQTGRLEEAYSRLKAVIETDPQLPFAQYLFGLSCLRRGEAWTDQAYRALSFARDHQVLLPADIADWMAKEEIRRRGPQS